MLILSHSDIGKGWRDLKHNEVITTLSQYLSFEEKCWKPSGFMTSDREINNRGRGPYRAPVSFAAKISAVWAARAKIWRRGILRRKE